MYETTYGLSGRPFRLAVDRQFYFSSESHRSAMAYLKYGLQEGEGFIVITGKTGTGKSTLVSKLFSELDLQKTVAAQVNAKHIVPEDAVKLICKAFGVSVKVDSIEGYLDAFEKFLIEQNKRKHHVLLIVDEAQDLPQQTLEELYTLSNYTDSGRPLFQCFLMGQPELLSTLARPSMAQLQNNVIGSYRLEPLDSQELRSYILYRLEKVGWAGTPNWEDTAVAIVYMETAGVPRRVNNLCENIMIYAASCNAKKIDEALVEAVIENLNSETQQLRQDFKVPPQHQKLPEPSLPAPPAQSSSQDTPPAMTAIKTTFTPSPDDNVTYLNTPPATQEQEQPQEYYDLKQRVAELEKQLQDHDVALREIMEFAVSYLAREENTG